MLEKNVGVYSVQNFLGNYLILSKKLYRNLRKMWSLLKNTGNYQIKKAL